MNDEFKYRLTFESTATGTGAKETTDALRQVEQGTDALAGSQKRGLAEMESSADKARVSQFAYYDLDEAMRSTGKQTETLTGGLTRLAPTTRNNAQALLMFSQGFEDASYGIRGVLNNIPGLVIALGGTAGLAGAISIAAVSLSQILPLFKKTEESAEATAEKIKEVAANMGEAQADDIAAVGDAIEQAADSADALRQNWNATREAEAEYSLSALSNAEKLSQAQTLIAEALGLQVDRFRELEQIAQREADKRRIAAEQAINAERAKLEASNREIEKAADVARAREAELAAARNARVEAAGRLEQLRAERAELEAIIAADAKRNAGSFGPGIAPARTASSPEAVAARSRLAAPEFEMELQGQQARLDELEKSILALTKDNGAISRAETAIQAAQTKAADTAAAVETNIRKIEETLAADDLLARSQTLVRTGEQFAKEIQQAFGDVESSTAQGRAAKDSLLAAAADGKITADEARGVADNMRTLVGQIQGGLASTNTSIRELMGLQKTFAQQQQEIQNDMSNLKAMVRGIASSPK